jgi:hypothetical protein
MSIELIVVESAGGNREAITVDDVQPHATTDGRIIESYAYGLYGAVAASTCTLVESTTLCAVYIFSCS